MHSLSRLWNRILIAWRWDQAVEKATNGRYQDALAEILTAERSVGTPISPKFTLLKAMLLRSLGDPRSAVVFAVQAHQQIKDHREFSTDEQKYLECFASVLGLKIMQEQNYTGTPAFSVDYASVDLSKIRTTTKKVFPLRDHPGWEKPTMDKTA